MPPLILRSDSGGEREEKEREFLDSLARQTESGGWLVDLNTVVDTIARPVERFYTMYLSGCMHSPLPT